MLRSILGFQQDAGGDWVAWLDCHHKRHVHHAPPFFERPWVTSAEGRAGKIGTALDCGRCDQFEWPDGLALIRTTPLFSRDQTPAGLLREHTTKTGTWGRLRVISGALTFHVDSLDLHRRLEDGETQVIVPNLPHHLALNQDVEFRIEFHRPP